MKKGYLQKANILIIFKSAIHQMPYNFLVITLCPHETIIRTSVPCPYRLLHIILWIVKRLNKDKHLLGFTNTISVRQGITPLAFPQS